MTTLLDTRRPRLLLTLFCLLLWSPGFLSLPPGDRDESRFAQGTKQMLESGDYVRIMNGTEARNRKPIGIYWLQAPFVEGARAAGLAAADAIWPYRVPSFLGGVAAVLACFAIGARLVGQRAALVAAGMLAASVLLTGEVHIAKTDAALLGATTVAMALLGRAYLAPGQDRGLGPWGAAGFWLAMGAGVLLKGPITPMVAGLCVLTLVVVDRRAGRGAAWLRGLRAGWGVPLLLLVVLPWFIAIGVATEGRFFADAVGGDLGRKLTSGDNAHGGLPGLHLLLLPLLLFPATAALPAGFILAWRERGGTAVRFLLAWIVPAWLVFEAAPTKLPHYTLPLYPAVCLLLARAVLSPRVIEGRAWWWWLGAALAGVAATAVAAVGVAGPVLLQMGSWYGVPVLLAAVLVGWFAVRGAGRAVVWAVVLMPLLYGALLEWELPSLRPLWIAPQVVSMAPPGALGAVGFAEPSLMFMAGTETAWLNAQEGAQALAAGHVTSLVVADRDLRAVEAELVRLGVTPRHRGEIHGFNYSRGRPVLLTVLTR